MNAVNKQLHDQGYHQNPMTDITAYYEIKTNQRRVLSLSLINYAFSGGAHGMTIQNSLTFNTQTGKSYTLSELFKPDSDYVARISEIVAAEIKRREIPLLVEFKGIRPDQDFYIADKSLVVYFQLYELAAYVYGFLYFPISIYTLQDIIVEDGPLGKMLY
ncbi:Peptidoglycan-N-acetylmuramic acid deacetylase PdaC [compost metagenome]